jgi:hypothetical protein
VNPLVSAVGVPEGFRKPTSVALEPYATDATLRRTTSGVGVAAKGVVDPVGLGFGVAVAERGITAADTWVLFPFPPEPDAEEARFA